VTLDQLAAELEAVKNEFADSIGAPRPASNTGASATEQLRLENMVKALQEDVKKKAMRSELE
jgi:hypothetical protein